MNEINFRINDIKEIKMSMDVGIKEIYPPIENLEVTPTKEKQVFNHENSYGYNEVIVESIPDEYIIPDGTLPITENATYDVRKYARVSASVYPTPNLQDKELTINENGTHNIVADEEYDGLNQVSVTVNAIENLTEELEVYDSELNKQETTIANIIETLRNKVDRGKYAPRYITFYEYKGTDLDYELENLDASNITSMYHMFEYCSNLTSIDLSGVTFGKPQIMMYAFYNNANLTSIKFGTIDASEVTSLSYTFSTNPLLTSLDLSTIDFSNVNSLYYTFNNCKALQYLDVRTINFPNVTSYDNMLKNVPTTCQIIVKDNDSKTWLATNFSSYKNVKTVAELEG